MVNKVITEELAPAATPMATMRVARGRTVMTGNRLDGTETAHREGAPVTLPAEEAKHLHALGFLKLEDEPETRPASFSNSEGPTTTEV